VVLGKTFPGFGLPPAEVRGLMGFMSATIPAASQLMNQTGLLCLISTENYFMRKRSVVHLAILLSVLLSCFARGADKPNILWLTAEDLSPNLGCYGDTYATTPNLDRFAARSLMYRHAWSCAPVCAPARTTIISGVYSTALGAHHMRSDVRMPRSIKMFPQLLREAGYYCVNNAKEDYNLQKPPGVWHDSSRNAHWKNRSPGQPFFAVFNHEITHESRIRRRPHTLVHDPAKARVPAYHPDTPEVRHDWAQYYDNITTMDRQVAERLKELEAAGLAEDTIVFFYGDHGSGMPRSKRWPYNSGLQVPFIIHVPEKWRHLAPKDYRPSGQTDRLVSFADLAPTVSSLAGVQPPDWMQGRAFMGKFEAPADAFSYGFRGRMDERTDLVRSVTDGRFVYVRNYMPHLIYGQRLDYMFQTPTTRVWKKLYDDGKLKPPQTLFWERKSSEELYDLQNDPDEVVNLANAPEHQAILIGFRQANRAHLLRTRDVGFLPEAEMHRRSENSTPYELGHDDAKFPLEQILKTAELASASNADALPALKAALAHTDSGVRYWGALGILIRGESAVETTRAELSKAMTDESPSVRIVAAQALAQYGSEPELRKSLDLLVDLSDVSKNGYWVCVEALNAIDSLGQRSRSIRAQIEKLPTQANIVPKLKEYVPRLLENFKADAR
jgi:arylsulfatase A-like enzyme